MRSPVPATDGLPGAHAAPRAQPPLAPALAPAQRSRDRLTAVARVLTQRRPPWSRSLSLALLAALGALALYAIHPGVVTDDTYGFLDWGRDLRHGYLPVLEHRTFHPLPILAGSLLSLLGDAAPTVTLLLTLAGLVLLAAAAWRILAALGFAQPVPLLAAALVLASPLLAVIADVAYINLPFATLVLWGLVLELEGRPRGAWALLIAAALVRPEGWAFLLAYGALSWWRAGHPRQARRWLPILALSLAPVAVWLGLEWSLFGDPLYSFHYTRPPFVESTGSDSVSGLWQSLRYALVSAPLVACALGVVAIAWLAPRGRALLTLGALVVSALTIAALAASSFNVPSRHFSVLTPLLCVLAAAGAALPGRVVSRRWPHARREALTLGVAGAVITAALVAGPALRDQRDGFQAVRTSHLTGRTLSHTVIRSRALIDVAGAPRHSVAMLGAVDNSELAWLLRVPFNAVTGDFEPTTRLVVEPSQATWTALQQVNLTDRQRWTPPPGWRRIASGDWDIYAPVDDAAAVTGVRLR